MAALVWPSDIVPNGLTDNRTGSSDVLESDLTGAATQRVTAFERFRFDITFPPLPPSLANKARAAMAEARKDGVIFPLGYGAYNCPAAGSSVLVNTAWTSANGYGLSVKGLPSGVAVPGGTWVSVQSGGIWYLYQTTETAAAGTTTRTLTMSGLAKVSHAVNDPVRIADPVVQGFVIPSARSIGVDWLSGMSMTVQER